MLMGLPLLPLLLLLLPLRPRLPLRPLRPTLCSSPPLCSPVLLLPLQPPLRPSVLLLPPPPLLLLLVRLPLPLRRLKAPLLPAPPAPPASPPPPSGTRRSRGEAVSVGAQAGPLDPAVSVSGSDRIQAVLPVSSPDGRRASAPNTSSDEPATLGGRLTIQGASGVGVGGPLLLQPAAIAWNADGHGPETRAPVRCSCCCGPAAVATAISPGGDLILLPLLQPAPGFTSALCTLLPALLLPLLLPDDPVRVGFERPSRWRPCEPAGGCPSPSSRMVHTAC